MREITRVGVDLAKNVIQIHAVDSSGKHITSRALGRDKFIPWCAQLPAGVLIAMEASSSAHHWARKLVALGLDARIIAAHLVAPYRLQGKSGKNDANDAAAICEADCSLSARRVSEDVIHRSDRRWSSSTNPLWHRWVVTTKTEWSPAVSGAALKPAQQARL